MYKPGTLVLASDRLCMVIKIQPSDKDVKEFFDNDLIVYDSSITCLLIRLDRDKPYKVYDYMRNIRTIS